MNDAATPESGIDVHDSGERTTASTGGRARDGIAREAYERTMAMVEPPPETDET